MKNIFLILFSLTFTSVFAEIIVNLDQSEGPATHRASGMLWGLNANSPSDNLLLPLKIKKYRSRLTPWVKGSGIDSFEQESIRSFGV